jgi:hypothetical protein
MNILQETNNQQPSLDGNIFEGSETISKESTQETVEAVSTLPDNAEGDDIVQKNFINKAINKFKNQFDYKLVNYINAKTKVRIICNKHNFIFEQTPDKHLQGKKPCPKCLHEFKLNYSAPTVKKECKNSSVYIKRLKDKFNINALVLTENGLNSEIEFNCEIHGKQKNIIRKLLLKNKKYSCLECANEQRIINKRKSIENLINNNFQIDFSNYIDRKSKLKCTCKKHGVFYKKAQNIIRGQGCFKCKIEHLVKNNILVGGYSKELFENKPEFKNMNAILYLLKINNYYKIGITTKNVNNRIKALKSKSKKLNECLNITVLKTETNTLYNCFLKEQLILEENSENRIFKKWSTELLNKIDINKYF